LLWTNFSGLFKSPVIKHRAEIRDGQTCHVLTMGSLVGFNLLQLEKQLARLPETEGVLLRFTESARIIDHTAVEFLQHIEEEAAAAGRVFLIEGTDHFQTFSVHPLASRMQEAQFSRKRAELDERAQRLAAVATRLGLEFSPATKATINRNDFVYLQRGDQREECNVIAGPWAGGHIRLFDYSHASAPDYHVAHRHTLMIFSWPAAVNFPDFVITPGHYLERYLTHLSEIAPTEAPGLPVGYRLYSVAGADLREALTDRLLNGLATLGPLYFELRGGIAVVFRPQCALEGEVEIEKFAAWATRLIDAGN